MADAGAPRDSRANLLYADEQAPLTWREAWRILVKSWPFVSRYRRLVAIKCVLVFVSLTFYLMTPWPLKIVIDNVIDGHPLTGIPGAILTPMVGASRIALLDRRFVISRADRDSDRNGPWRRAGARHQREQRRSRSGRHHRQRRQRRRQPVERPVRLSRVAHHDRSHAADEPIAAHRDLRAIFALAAGALRRSENRRRGLPRDVRQRVDRPGILSRRARANHVGLHVRDGDHRALDTIQQRAGDHRRRDSVSARGRNRQHTFRTRDPRSEPVDARERQQRDGRLRRTRRAGPAHQGVRTGVARDGGRRRRKLAVFPLDAPHARDLFS